jgi:hypothetical protein
MARPMLLKRRDAYHSLLQIDVSSGPRNSLARRTVALGSALLGVLLVLAPVAPAALGAAVTSSAPAPVLGRQWDPGQVGYGKVRPSRIFNGGDPTGEVNHIHWMEWGAGRAIGVGEAEYDWPGTAVADNGFTSGARVVAFHLGRCRGHSSYNAIEWFFPKYGQTFQPHTYIDTCSGRYVGQSVSLSECGDAPLGGGAGEASEVQVSLMSCAAAQAVIALINPTPYVKLGGRFVEDGYRCGTEGAIEGPSALFACQLDEQEFVFTVAA